MSSSNKQFIDRSISVMGEMQDEIRRLTKQRDKMKQALEAVFNQYPKTRIPQAVYKQVAEALQQ